MLSHPACTVIFHAPTCSGRPSLSARHTHLFQPACKVYAMLMPESDAFLIRCPRWCHTYRRFRQQHCWRPVCSLQRSVVRHCLQTPFIEHELREAITFAARCKPRLCRGLHLPGHNFCVHLWHNVVRSYELVLIESPSSLSATLTSCVCYECLPCACAHFVICWDRSSCDSCLPTWRQMVA